MSVVALRAGLPITTLTRHTRIRLTLVPHMPECIIAIADCAVAPYHVSQRYHHAGERETVPHVPVRRPRAAGGALAGWYRCVVTTHSPSTRHAVQTTSVSRVQNAHSLTAKPLIRPKSKRTGERSTRER